MDMEIILSQKRFRQTAAFFPSTVVVSIIAQRTDRRNDDLCFFPPVWIQLSEGNAKRREQAAKKFLLFHKLSGRDSAIFQ